MPRFLRFVTIVGTLIPVLLPVTILQASAQELRDDNTTCYLRIEGRGTQDVSHLCGKKQQQPDSKSTQNSPATRSAQPLATTDSNVLPDDDAADAIPTRRSSIPSTRFPSSRAPSARSPLTVPSATPSPSPSPNRVTPNQTPNSNPDLLPVPKLPVSKLPVPKPLARQPQPARRSSVTATLKPRSQPQSQVITALKPQPIPTRPIPAPPVRPQPTFNLRSPSPVVAPLPLPSNPALDATAPLAKPQLSPVDRLLEHLQAQKYFYLFWVLFLQVPLLKVAIEQRSRPKTVKRGLPRKPLKPVANASQPQQPDNLVVADLAVADLAVADLAVANVDETAVTPIAIAASTALEPENITKAAEYHLSQADNQIAQIKVLLASAVRNRVSDIHLEPTPEGLRVRYRIDGILRDVTMLPLEVSRRTIVALKVMADMDISESRRPQDARISEQYTSSTATSLDLDLRVSTLPCIGGEKAVIRLLPRQNPFSQMDELGFTEKALALYQSWLQQPQGMIIFTGPTGSGKTSTLYTSLQAIATEHVNVVTVEDPVEYILPCITQTQVNETAGMTFAAGLRAILRQDPDIIMVGEIRDHETAETAIRAALTGHLVLTTLHTNDAIGAIPRLKDVGPDPGLISDALLGVVAQRLVRRVCLHCATPYTPTDADLQTLGLNLADSNAHAWRHGVGCSHCFHSGYLGREAIIELLHVDATIRQLIYEGTLAELTHYLHESQFESFRKAAIAKVTAGVTTVAEVRRVLPASKLTMSA